jgi:hypothetical protein
MRSLVNSVLVTSLVLFHSGLAQADEQSDLRAIVNKAIKAHGGVDKLTKLRAMNIKTKYIWCQDKYRLQYDNTRIEVSIELPDKIRNDVSYVFRGSLGRVGMGYVDVVNDDKGWNMVTSTRDMSNDELADTKESLYVAWVTQLYPLQKDEFTLVALGEVVVGNQETLGVKVSHAGHRDVCLYFDKISGMLVKRDAAVKDPIFGGPPVAEELIYEEYKEVDGVKYASKMTAKRGGRRVYTCEVTEYSHRDKLEDSVFAKPALAPTKFPSPP